MKSLSGLFGERNDAMTILQVPLPENIVFSLPPIGEVCRFTVKDGAFDVVVPPDLPMTEAAKAFIEVLRVVLPQFGFTLPSGKA